ncbi:MAG: hypothetical protein ACJ8R9_05120 [Steroidobacteraceae bacterium]
MIIFSSVICLFDGNVAGMESPFDISAIHRGGRGCALADTRASALRSHFFSSLRT